MKQNASLMTALFLVLMMFTRTTNAQTQPPVGTPVIQITTTTAGTPVRMDMKAAVENTPVWIETADGIYIKATAGTNWQTDHTNYTPTGTNLKIHGAITCFDCSGIDADNKNPISALDVSKNTGLQELYCSYNQLQSLNVQGLTQLKWLSCKDNQLHSLNVQDLTQLKYLYCHNNHLQSLNVETLNSLQKLWCNDNQLQDLKVQNLSSLQGLYCYNNQLQSLNLHGLTQLENLRCQHNKLQDLNLHDLTQLKWLLCWNNPCSNTTLGLDQIYCQLPERQEADYARIYVTGQRKNDLEAFVIATNGANANNKNWKLYNAENYEITNTTGTYLCKTTGIESVESTVSIYPNPASDAITLETDVIGSAITITDLAGRTVLQATATGTKTTLDISGLSAGTYVVRIGERVGKIWKM